MNLVIVGFLLVIYLDYNKVNDWIIDYLILVRSRCY